MDIQQLTAEYDSKSDEELLRLALNAEELTPEAKTLLSNELAKRRINTRGHLEAARQRQEQERENNNSPEKFIFAFPFGLGRTARIVVWLGNRRWGLSFLLALASLVAAVMMAVQHPGGLVQSLLYGPISDAGTRLGMIVFPDYSVQGTNGFYIVPLFGIAADFLTLMVIWFLAIQLVQWLRNQKQHSSGSQI